MGPSGMIEGVCTWLMRTRITGSKPHKALWGASLWRCLGARRGREAEQSAGRGMTDLHLPAPHNFAGLRAAARRELGYRRMAVTNTTFIRSSSRSGTWNSVGIVLWLSLCMLCPYLCSAQYSFQVRFPELEDDTGTLKPLNLPNVDCGLVASPTGLQRAYLSDKGSCKECTKDCTTNINSPACLCINSFDIATTEVNQFNGMDEDVTVCKPTDTNGIQIDLTKNDFRITFRKKSPTFNAPDGHRIEISSKDLKCNRGVWSVPWVTSIAGQYILSIELKTGETATGTDILTPLMTPEKVLSPFETKATFVRPSIKNPDNYFIDTVTSLLPVCTSATLACQHCISPGTNGGCSGNPLLPAVQKESQIIVYPGDRFFNPVSELCLGKVVDYTIFRALKIPYVNGATCTGGSATERCRSLQTTQRPVETWDKLETKLDCKEEVDKATEYHILFTPSFSGFYSIQIPKGPPSIMTIDLGPFVIPVQAANVDPKKTFAHGNGIFGVVQSELATFTIQPMDKFGNHHTSGMHIFQVTITQIEPLSAFRLVVDPVDTGQGTSAVEYQLQNPAIYSMEVRYCKDLLKYPPYSAAENRICDLSTSDYQGPNIQSSPFRVEIRPYQFFIPLISVPGMAPQFRFGDVGIRYFVLFTANFPVCGQTYGSPRISERYNPVVRFDLASMTYLVYPPPMKLDPSHVRPIDVTSGLWASTRYSDYAGKCLMDGYVFTFLFTVSGLYRTWIYSDTTSPRIVAESPRTFLVAPDVRVINNFRGSGPIVRCAKEIDCMANQDTWLIVQAKDRFFNNATSCSEVINVHVVPVSQATDYFRVTNLVDLADEDGVPINGVPSPPIFESTRSGYVAMPISAFYGSVKACTKGMYEVSVLASLSAQYRVSVTVDDRTLYGSPFPVTIYPQQRQLMPDIVTSGLVTVTRWTYYRIYFDRPYIGFHVEVIKTDANNGQPWTFMRHDDIFADIQEPDETAGIRYEYPDARQSIYCRSCRIHVPPPKAKLGVYYISVYGYEDDSFHTIVVSAYNDQFITSGNPVYSRLQPGRYSYYRFKITSTSGFQIRVSVSGNTQGSLTTTMKKDEYPLTDQDPSSIFGQTLWMKNCIDCVIDHPPSLLGRGNWYISVLGHNYPIDFQVILIEFSEKAIDFGSQSNMLSLRALTWGYYTFTIDPDIEPAGFRLSVIPTNAAYNITTVLKKAQHPITLTDSTFKSKACTHCRISVMTRQKLQGKWYIGVYAGATGGEFDLKVKLLEVCPNDCFGNGVCIQRKIKVCRCFPGYTGVDCREAIKEKIFAWYPLDGQAADFTPNKRPLFYKVNKLGTLKYENEGISLMDTYLIIPKPTPAIVCSQFTRLAEPEPADLQWGNRRITNEGTADSNRVNADIPEVGEWYTWNTLGKPKGNPLVDRTCAEYHPRREMTVMFNIRVDERGLSPGSLMTLGKPSMVVGRTDADDVGKWSWSFYPMPHPNGRHIVFDFYLRNLTHEISLKENQIYPIDGKPIFEKPDFWSRTFPNGWCIDALRPTNKDGRCVYIEKKRYYHVAMVFGPRRIEVYVDAVLVGQMKLDLWNITECEGCRVQFGHDPRYSPFERLFFGQVRDIRILRYSASHEELKTLVANGSTWFKWREAVRKQVGIVSNPGSWEDPLPLTGLDDGSLDPNLTPHAEVCQNYRNPNEPRDLQFEANCPFIDADTAWIFKEQYDRYYRKFDTDRVPFGLGHEETVILDTRPKPKVYLGRYYDFSIDEE